MGDALQSARGLAQTKTLSRIRERKRVHQILECASPLALSSDIQTQLHS